MFNWFKKPTEQNKLFYHTDVHCHILPGVDHGAQTVDDSLALIEKEMELGIDTIIATPHITEVTFENTPETIAASYEVLKKAVEENDLPVKLYYSAEYRLDAFSLKQFENGQFAPMPGKVLLLENSFQQELLGIDDLIFNLQLKGFEIILAHPERYGYYSYRHGRYAELHERGVKFQMNILSLAGYFGQGARENAEWMLKHDCVDYLGSDMHNLDHARVIADYVNSKEWKKISKRIAPNILNDQILDWE